MAEGTEGGLTYLVTARPDSWELALEDVRAADPGARLGEAVGPGLFLVSSCREPASLAYALRRQGPFVRHLFPVAQWVAGAPALAALAAAAEAAAAPLDAQKPVAVQVRALVPGLAADVRAAIEGALAAGGWVPTRGDAPQVLSVVVGASASWVGASAALHNLSPAAGGIITFAHPATRVSRAAGKLLEAFWVFDLPWPSAGRALDVGAAPGGWTQVLLARGLDVVAVDPAALDARVARHPKLTHWRGTVQTYTARPPDGAFSLIVNDMRVDAAETARLMGPLADRLDTAGVGVVTLKLHPARRRRQMRAALDHLALAFRILGCRQLYHNRSEVTVALAKRGPPPSPEGVH